MHIVCLCVCVHVFLNMMLHISYEREHNICIFHAHIEQQIILISNMKRIMLN